MWFAKLAIAILIGTNVYSAANNANVTVDIRSPSIVAERVALQETVQVQMVCAGAEVIQLEIVTVNDVSLSAGEQVQQALSV